MDNKTDAAKEVAVAYEHAVEQQSQPQKIDERLRYLKRHYGFTNSALSRMTGLSERTIVTLSIDATSAQKNSMRAINSLWEILWALSEVVKIEYIPEWLLQPNESLGGMRPDHIIEQGEFGRLWEVVHRLRDNLAI